MVGADEALRLLENKVRRQILERLVREPHYPLQLAQQIGVSQQAIMKHLKIHHDQELPPKIVRAHSHNWVIH